MKRLKIITNETSSGIDASLKRVCVWGGGGGGGCGYIYL
jgi:hypothetical protein